MHHTHLHVSTPFMVFLFIGIVVVVGVIMALRKGPVQSALNEARTLIDDLKLEVKAVGARAQQDIASLHRSYQSEIQRLTNLLPGNNTATAPTAPPSPAAAPQPAPQPAPFAPQTAAYTPGYAAPVYPPSGYGNSYVPPQPVVQQVVPQAPLAGLSFAEGAAIGIGALAVGELLAGNHREIVEREVIREEPVYSAPAYAEPVDDGFSFDRNDTDNESDSGGFDLDLD